MAWRSAFIASKNALAVYCNSYRLDHIRQPWANGTDPNRGFHYCYPEALKENYVLGAARLENQWHAFAYETVNSCLHTAPLENHNSGREFYDYCPKGYSFDQVELVCRRTVAKPLACTDTHNNTPDTVNNPIQASTGNKYQRETDYTGSGAFPLRFQRHYNHQSFTHESALGLKWRHHYGRSIALAVKPDETVTTAYVFRPNGQARYFNLAGTNTWVTNPNVTTHLERFLDGSGNTTDDNLVEDYDADGQLLSITNLAGFSHTLDYNVDSDPDTLDTVAGPFGRTLQFTYYTSGDEVGRLHTLIDPAGQTYTYSYEPFTHNAFNGARLSTVTR